MLLAALLFVDVFGIRILLFALSTYFYKSNIGSFDFFLILPKPSSLWFLWFYTPASISDEPRYEEKIAS